MNWMERSSKRSPRGKWGPKINIPLNKMTLKHLPMPSFVSSLQFMCASVFVYGLKASGNAEVDDFEADCLDIDVDVSDEDYE